MLKNICITVFILLLIATVSFAESIEGRVIDRATQNAMPGANVSVVGTNFGSSTDQYGHFIIRNINPGEYQVKVTYMGYEPMTKTVVLYSNRVVNENFLLESAIIDVEGIIISANRAVERETPVAFSDVKAEKIKKQFTVQDVPNMIKHVPGVYVTSDGGSGMGDTGMMIRGFDMQRVQVMINNVPVNDPESKKVYWSNWGSLPAASQSIQVQRGVGSSQYGSGAFGGSVNVVTSEAPAVSSFNVNLTGGLYSTYKAGVDYNTGLLNGKHSFLARFNYLNGNGFRRDTHYKGLQYYFAYTNFITENQTLRLILHGAPQMHAYTYYSMPIKNFVKYGRDFNAHPYVNNDDAGLTNRETDGTSLMDVLTLQIDTHKGGEIIGNGYTSFDNNVYHKPQLEAHHNWSLGKDTRLQSTAFFSMGRGYGENVNAYYLIKRNNTGMFSMNSIADANTYQYRAHSIHNQMGLLSNISTKWNGHDLSAGFEGRYWWARHYGTITNTFGQETIGYRIGGIKGQFREGDVYYDYYGVKPQITGFAHALWNFGDLSIMTDAQYSYRHYRIYEDMPANNNRPADNGTYVVKQNLEGGNNDGFVNIEGTKYNLLDFTKNYNFLAPKIGANYNLTRALNIFVNYSKAYNEPRVKYFYNYGQPSDALPIETSDDIEVGFGLRSGLYSLKVNGYNIDFSNKAYRVQDPTMANEPGYDYKGRRYIEVGDAVYRGVEVAGSYNLTRNLELGLSLSKMKNAWGDKIAKEAQEQLGIEKGKIEPGMPQFIFNGMVDYSFGDIWLSGTFSMFQDYYILPDNSDVEVDGKMQAGEFVATKESPTLPSWKLLSVIVGYNLQLSGYHATISLHLNNLLDEDYLQIGNEYGVLPGAERNIQVNLSLGL